MLAVVQIGSSTVRSPCITARIVLATGGGVCAVGRPGAATAAVAASPVLRKSRREDAKRLAIGVPPCALGWRSGLNRRFMLLWPVYPALRPIKACACGDSK